MDDEFGADECAEQLTELKHKEIYKDMRVNAYGELPRSTISIEKSIVDKRMPDMAMLCPYFGWTPVERIRKTLENTMLFIG